MPLSKRLSPLLLITLLLTTPSLSLAASDSSDASSNRPERRHGPPPEFVTACEGKQVGEAVVIETPHGDTIDATCQQRGDQLVAHPINPPPPPPEKEAR